MHVHLSNGLRRSPKGGCRWSATPEIPVSGFPGKVSASHCPEGASSRGGSFLPPEPGRSLSCITQDPACPKSGDLGGTILVRSASRDLKNAGLSAWADVTRFR